MTICEPQVRCAAGMPGPARTLTTARDFDGVGGVMVKGDEFESLVAAVVGRFFAQKRRAPPSVADLARFTAQLRQLIAERGLPAPLGDRELGVPGGMSEEECAPLVARVSAGTTDPLLADAARQLVKACFYPEFKVCRDSYREVARDGSCRRQELDRVLGRVSGSHCVDCPHWIVLPPREHAQLLEGAWVGGPEEFRAHQDVYLPEDFRALRRWLHAAARGPR